MTDELAAIEARANAAPPGLLLVGEDINARGYLLENPGTCDIVVETYEDAMFYSSAQPDILALMGARLAGS